MDYRLSFSILFRGVILILFGVKIMGIECCRCKLIGHQDNFVQRRDGLICPPCAHQEMIYLATPYSHPSPEIREIRFKQACILAGQLIQEGHRVFSPIVAYHPIATYFDLPGDFEYWKRVDEIHMGSCTIVYVAKFVGWDDSKGIAYEIDLAPTLKIPVFYVEIPNA